MDGFCLTSWNQPFLSPAKLQGYANAIARQGNPIADCCGFISGMVRRPVCLPGKRKKKKEPIVFNAREGVYTLKF